MCVHMYIQCMHMYKMKLLTVAANRLPSISTCVCVHTHAHVMSIYHAPHFRGFQICEFYSMMRILGRITETDL